MTSGRIEGKVALVTGSGTGIGRAVAVRLAEEGALVTLASRSPENLEETATLVKKVTGSMPKTFIFDQADSESIKTQLEKIMTGLGAIDILSNNAGFDDPDETPIANTDDSLWAKTFDVNVGGVFRICRASIPYIRNRGTIINIGSANSIVPRRNAAAYCASKAAVLQFTRSLALELADRAIRANCVCPGVIDTPLTDLFLNKSADPEILRSEYALSNPLGRIASPVEIANCVLFLASDESSFVTGSALVADGGSLAGG